MRCHSLHYQRSINEGSPLEVALARQFAADLLWCIQRWQGCVFYRLRLIPLRQEKSELLTITRDWAVRHAFARLSRSRASRIFTAIAKRETAIRGRLRPKNWRQKPLARLGLWKISLSSDCLLVDLGDIGNRLNAICPNDTDPTFWSEECGKLLNEINELIETYSEQLDRL